MNPATILIVSNILELNVNRVVAELDRVGARWIRLNCEEYPLLVGGTVRADRIGDVRSLTIERAQVDLDAVDTVWHRRISRPALPRRLDARDRSFVHGEVAAFLEGLFDRGKWFWVNDRQAERQASNKLRQLRIARDIGLEIPETLVSNDPEAIRQFAAASPGRVIFKPVSGFAPRSSDLATEAHGRFGEWGEVAINEDETGDIVEVVFAKILDAEKLRHIDSIRACPATFQHFIEKQADVRVTVVGREVFACRIDSQSDPRTSVDFRRAAIDGETAQLEHRLVDLPREIRVRLIALMDRLGLQFGCIDFVEDEDGGLVFLEINPAGQWMWIETLTGAPITTALANLLAFPLQFCRT